ncbi:hypothetical protein TELCIR_10175 [Teladorsagia circumcincta]|uniref:7TM GPCR serpentine receptor class x (Srx) domain-containing protein n=1 Tax=Teladorsagia circumcincta TaxID=45464 RepID=A0A2G9UCT7_TELCI|nr:hypothetical protein TELCIR_10175 [Teladorsagia circumcincta]
MMKAQSHDTTNVAIRRRRHLEVRFFWQTLYQNVVFFYELSSFYYICNLFENEWLVFFTSTFAWEICHALDGFVIVLFHFRWSELGKVHAHDIPTTMINSGKHVGEQLRNGAYRSNFSNEKRRSGNMT